MTTQAQYIESYLKNQFPIYHPDKYPTAKLKLLAEKGAKAYANKKIKESAPDRAYRVTYRIPAGAVSTVTVTAKSGDDAFAELKRYNEGIKRVSVKLK